MTTSGPRSSLIMPDTQMRRRSLSAGATALGIGATAIPVGAQEPNKGCTLRAGIAGGGTTDGLDPMRRLA